MRFAKGHGTGNDFLILPDPDDTIVMSPEFAVRLCDRRTGLGADGILRAVRTAAVGAISVPGSPAAASGRRPEAKVGLRPPPGDPLPGSPAETSARGPQAVVGLRPPPGDPLATVDPVPEWFMDYRNADGSVAEMCGNGIRVFARYLLSHGLADGPEFVVATRSGPRLIRAEPDGGITVDMGLPRMAGRGSALIGGVRCEGLRVSMGNPHLACLVDAPVASFDLAEPPVVDQRMFPDGANVEVVRIRADGQLEMRVHERGSGATLSCGTGAVAAAVAAQAQAQPQPQPQAQASAGAARNGQAGQACTWTVHVPGGTLRVTLTGTTSLLTGPAVIVAEGELTEDWLSDLAGSLAAGSTTA
jgi:diaminopimelate epimerase